MKANVGCVSNAREWITCEECVFRTHPTVGETNYFTTSELASFSGASEGFIYVQEDPSLPDTGHFVRHASYVQDDIAKKGKRLHFYLLSGKIHPRDCYLLEECFGEY